MSENYMSKNTALIISMLFLPLTPPGYAQRQPASAPNALVLFNPALNLDAPRLREMICLSIAALAQVTGVATLQGVVTDNSNAVLANAEITVTNLDTGVAVKAMTNQAGLYRV